MKTRTRTIGWASLLAGAILIPFSFQFRRESNWLGLLPGLAAILILVGVLLLVRWYFRKDGNAPRWARLALKILGILLLGFVILNAITLGGLGADLFG